MQMSMILLIAMSGPGSFIVYLIDVQLKWRLHPLSVCAVTGLMTVAAVKFTKRETVNQKLN